MDPFKDNTQLIEALKSGKPKAYTFLVDTYHHKLCVYAYGLTRDHDLAEDIVQNIFIKTWNKREKLKTEFSISSFLYKLTYNEFIDQYRKQKNVFPLEKKYIDELTIITEDQDPSSIEQMIALVKKEIQNLPPKCRETFLLSKEEGLTNIEIAEYKSISLKTVEAHITKAFAILREKVGEKIEGILFLLFG
ncbi:RNA polymerase sigma-70 factor [Xanthomarina sp. F1114]|uniref:RNA polymerase sigma factor n=1 Tax=Xanthomarina sp. F1114 TaxID=2996019 RepID=UPI00225DE724|nr:RNA polymerase sigma-70 factor [Xanthomarina sp. F1114]MCX7547200.1 RNA polymerase sigma-70 factor [Xanthomarina sp. F1114]